MGWAKEQLIEKDEHERLCPECGATVWINWGYSPNLKCSSCGYTDDVKDCEECGEVMPVSNEASICSDCLDRKIEKE